MNKQYAAVGKDRPSPKPVTAIRQSEPSTPRCVGPSATPIAPQGGDAVRHNRTDEFDAEGLGVAPGIISRIGPYALLRFSEIDAARECTRSGCA